MPQGVETYEAEAKSIITTTTNIRTVPSKLARIIVASGTGQIDVYDHASADSNLIFSKASTAVGDIYSLQIPCVNGIRVKMAAAGQLCVTWS